MNIRNTFSLTLCVVSTLALVYSFSHAQDQSTDRLRIVRFINTTDDNVGIYWLNNDGKPEHFADLKPKMQIDQPSQVGQQWVIRSKGQEIATYEVDASKAQFLDTSTNQTIDHVVDIKQLAAWQTKVEVVFANTTNEELDILWVDPEGVEHVYAIELQPGMEYVQSKANPLDKWTVRRHGELMCEYSVSDQPSQRVDLAQLIEKTKTRVAVIFQNTTDQPFDVYWIDDNGQAVLYADAIPPGYQHIQLANPGQTWQCKSADKVVGQYVVQKTDDIQIFDPTKK